MELAEHWPTKVSHRPGHWSREALERLAARHGMARCNGKGWKVEKGVCYPMQNSDGNVYGWALP